jgi:hypothetical protein
MGHGTWDTKGAVDAYTKVPKGTSLIIYTPIGRFIGSSQTSDILLDAPGRLNSHHTFTEFKSCPNTTLSHGLFIDEEDALTNSGKTYYHPGAGLVMKLSDILNADGYKGNTLHWLACQPRFNHLDTTQGGFNDDYLLGP